MKKREEEEEMGVPKNLKQCIFRTEVTTDKDFEPSSWLVEKRILRYVHVESIFYSVITETIVYQNSRIIMVSTGKGTEKKERTNWCLQMTSL